MLQKTASRILPLPFFTAFLTAIIFLAVILAALFLSKHFNIQESLIQRLIIKPISSTYLNKNSPEVIGFLPSWMVAKNIKVDTKNLTQIIYFGLGVNSKGEIIQFNEQGSETQEWVYLKSDYFKNLKIEAKKTDTKLLIAIKSFDNKNIDDLVSNKTLTENFINQLIKIIKEEELDGVNIDFEYFTDSDFPTFKHLNQFFITLNQRLKTEDPNLIVSADFNASVIQSDPAYDMVKIGNEIDQIILMGYDYTTTLSTKAGPVAPLYANEGELSIDRSIQAILGRVPTGKVILAIPFYGYEWQTTDNKFMSQTIPETGALATYDRVIELINNRQDIEINWDAKSQTPWISYSQSQANKQIYFENEQSIAKKLEYIKKTKLAGVGIWALGYEGENSTFWELISKFRD